MIESWGVRTKHIILSALLAVLIGAVGYLALHEYHQARFGDAVQKFGIFPAFAWEFDEDESRIRGGQCYRVAYVNPPVHWSGWGEMWQEPHFLWEDIRLLSPAPDAVLEHERTGPVRVGDLVCGWAEEGWLVTIDGRDGYHLWCRSIRAGPNYPPCERP